MTQRIKAFVVLISRLTLAVSAFVFAGCSGSATPGNPSALSPPGPESAGKSPSLTEPALIAFNTYTGTLGYWPIRHGGSETLAPLTGSLGISSGYAMAANGNLMVIANYSPAEVVNYNLKTKAQATMSDPYGGPYDVAIDKKGDIYALNLASVALYKAGSSQPSELTCSYITTAEAIAIDNEGDVFVDGYGPSGFQGIVKYPAASQSCTKLHLRAVRGYIGGVGVDPKTDDLIVIDDPGLCAGGPNGRMVIYPKPYKQRTSIRRELYSTYCSGTFRLDAGSTHIFYSDTTVSAGFPLVDEARYPSGKYEGQYSNGYYSSGFGGFTTIPNRLPN